MIKYKEGSVLDASETVIAHGCNCKGRMASGVAKAIREKWPHVYDTYKAHEEQFGLELGRLHMVYIGNGQRVANLITQESYGRDGKRYVDYDAIDSCFRTLNEALPEEASVAIPKIGAGLGGGDWTIIEAIINERMPARTVVCYEIVSNNTAHK